MESDPSNSTEDPSVRGARFDVRAAERLVRDERRRIVRERWMHLLLLGFALSVIAHVLVMVRLWAVKLPDSAPARMTEVALELQELPPEVELQPEVDLPDPTTLVAGPITVDPDPIPSLSTEIASGEPTAEPFGTIEAPGSGAVVGAGASGSGIGIGSGKGGGGTSFFGIGGRGTRFAFIVDVSGSMEDDGRIVTAMSELKRSIGALPDFAEFFVILFADGAYKPEWQDGWQRASRGNVARMRRWLDEEQTRGGTLPLAAIDIVFKLPRAPDVVFFLTDGIVPGDTIEHFKEYIARARAETVVHTIGFSSEAGKEPLMQIAKNHRGIFRFVPIRRRPDAEANR